MGSEWSYIIVHPADVKELLGVGEKPTHMVTRCIRTDVFYVKVKEKHRTDRVFPNMLRLETREGTKEGEGRRGDREPRTD